MVEHPIEASGGRGRQRWWIGGVAVLLAAGGWVALDGDDEPTVDDMPEPMDTLDRFLDAQRTGDCAGLRDVVSEDSWSLHGGRTAGEFDRLCEDALEGHTVLAPAAENLFHVGLFGPDVPEPDTRVEVTSGSTPEGAPEGTLLWDGERWLVELDPHVLSLGRSPRETVERYVAAYSEGDCDAMFDHLGPDLDTPDARDACERWAALRADSEEPPVVAGFMYPTTAGGAETAQVEVDFDRRLHPTAPGDTAHLAVDGLEWVIESTTTGAATPDPTAPPFVELRYHDLAAALLDQAPSPGGSCRGPDVYPVETGAVAVSRLYEGCPVRLRLFDHGDPDRALEEAQVLGDQRAGEEPLLSSSAPNRRADVPGHPDAHGVLVDCCPAAFVVQAWNGYVIEVELEESDDLTLAAEVLDAQIARLATVDPPEED